MQCEVPDFFSGQVQKLGPEDRSINTAAVLQRLQIQNNEPLLCA